MAEKPVSVLEKRNKRRKRRAMSETPSALLIMEPLLSKVH